MSESGRDAETDTTVTVEIDQDELYTAVRTGIEDALLDVLGTVLLLALALLLVGVGVQAIVETPSSVNVAFGGVMVGLGLAITAAAFDLLPPFRG
ncbi:hypothetical protein SAMN04487967_1196 [Natronorubrum sediminis]|uniref:Uncharacterized protein n=1 Tax=Natronorubrum sediminis TaxID=640943 RepID=A0A1H6FTQ1_9EURY|nr:hypothetical protein [Natronorubrum sediminis]SEH13175.1 hypothetical protein SAMN04487967_1196 [Natronorubrum sediminis]